LQLISYLLIEVGSFKSSFMKAISTIYEIGTTQFASLSIYVILKSQSRARTIIESCFKDDSASLLESLFHFLYNAKCDTVQQFVANIVIPLYVLKKKIVRQLMMPALYIWQHQICKEQFATQTFFLQVLLYLGQYVKKNQNNLFTCLKT
jgi:hypothetical protein